MENTRMGKDIRNVTTVSSAKDWTISGEMVATEKKKWMH
jgi:hypothetical protein